MNTENIILYFVFSLIVIIFFSLFGSIIIMYLDKKGSFHFPCNRNCSKTNLANFLFLGCCISGVGSFLGFIMGFIIIIIQKTFPLFTFQSTSLAYPVEIQFEICLAVLLTVFILGCTTSLAATAGIRKKAYLYLN